MLLILLVLAGNLSLQRSQVWRTPATLWTDALAKAPLMPRPHIYMGDVYKGQGRHQEALDSYQRALAVNPKILSGGDLLAINNNTGSVYLAMGLIQQADFNPEAGRLLDILATSYHRDRDLYAP